MDNKQPPPEPAGPPQPMIRMYLSEKDALKTIRLLAQIERMAAQPSRHPKKKFKAIRDEILPRLTRLLLMQPEAR